MHHGGKNSKPAASCVRCSVDRVNILCRLYEEAITQDGTSSQNDLESLIHLAETRGYNRGYDIRSYGLAKKALRSVCWNISSLLTDEDMRSRGLMPGKKNERRRRK